MDSKKRVRVIIHVLLVIAVMAFIFSHSMANRAQSTSESMGVFEFLMKLLGTVGLGDGLTEYIVRKMAHFSEFAALGFFLLLSAFWTVLSIHPRTYWLVSPFEFSVFTHIPYHIARTTARSTLNRYQIRSNGNLFD